MCVVSCLYEDIHVLVDSLVPRPRPLFPNAHNCIIESYKKVPGDGDEDTTDDTTLIQSDTMHDPRGTYIYVHVQMYDIACGVQSYQ